MPSQGPHGIARIGAVTVYCSAREGLAGPYTSAAARLGDLIARAGWRLVYGGGAVGLMGVMARACRAKGGRVTGVITERLRDAEQLDPDNDEIIIVRTMRERKAILEARGDAMIVLPGGLGTMEEFFEILVGRHLGEHDKPIVLINTPDPAFRGDRGYYGPLLDMIEHMIEGGFAGSASRTLFHECAAPDEAVAFLGGLEPVEGADAEAPELSRP